MINFLTTLHFLSPVWFLLLLAVAGLAVAYIWRQVRRRHVAMRFTNVELLRTVAPRVLGVRRHIASIILLLALLALTTAMARPAVDKKVPVERGTVVLAMDVSLSMEAEDVSPNRLAAAQEAAKLFVDELSDNYNLALVTFAGSAQVAVPPTKDHSRVKQAIDEVQLQEYTAIGEAIFASLKTIEQVSKESDGDKPPARIVLLSDGETTSGRSNESAAQEAVEKDTPVTTIAFGTDEGYVEQEGQQVPVPVDGPALEKIAQTTEGDFYEAVTAQELDKIYEDLGSLVDYETADRDVTYIFLGVGLGLTLLAGVFSLLWTSRLT